MCNLSDYIRGHTIPTDVPNVGINVFFFQVAITGGPDAEILKALISQQAKTGKYQIGNLFDGTEHSYIELGAMTGSPEEALCLMALGQHFNWWHVRTPQDVQVCTDSISLYQLAGQGYVTVKYGDITT